MIAEMAAFATPFASLIALAFGIAWGLVLAHAAVFAPRIGVAAALGASFLLVQAAIRGLDSATPEISVARNLGSFVLWLVFMAAVSLTWLAARRVRG